MKNQKDRNHFNCLATVNIDDGLHWGTGKSAKTAWNKSVFDSDSSYQQLTLGQRFLGMFGPENGLCRGMPVQTLNGPRMRKIHHLDLCGPDVLPNHLDLCGPDVLPNFQSFRSFNWIYRPYTILTYIIHMVRYVENTYILDGEHHPQPTNWMGSWTRPSSCCYGKKHNQKNKWQFLWTITNWPWNIPHILICVYIYMYIYIYIYTYFFLNIYIYMHIYIYTYIHIYLHICTYIYIHIHINIYIYVCIYAYI